jgi:uncharacterized protein YbcI
LQGAEDKPTGKDPREGRSAAREKQGSVEDAVGWEPLEPGQTASGSDEALSSSDQTGSESDQTASDRDQTGADSNQAASDEDQAASDQESAEGADQRTRDLASVHREHATHLRDEQSRARRRTGVSRDIAADERAQVASARDRRAKERDAAAKAREEEVELPAPVSREERTHGAARARQRAAFDRARAAGDRARVAEDRAEAPRDLTHGPHDRGPAADVHANRGVSDTPLAGGHLLTAISTSIVGILREHYGRGPMKAKTYALDDIIVVVMRGSGFTPLERTIMESGDPDRVIAMREDFQRVMAKRYKETIEELTARNVLAFLSQAHVEPDITMEIFFIDRPLDGFGAVEIIEPVD